MFDLWAHLAWMGVKKMKQSEIDILNEIRAMCHGFSAAISIVDYDGEKLDVEAMQEKLQEANKNLADMLAENATYTQEGKWVAK